MEKEVFSFFKENIDYSKPILLGLSGGPDSTCLLHLLLEFRKERWFDLQLIHVNHGWRLESDYEEEQLKTKAENLKLPIHITRLNPKNYKGNLEAEARKERFRFFSEIFDLTKSQYVILGHHLQDQRETVFKKMLEGSMLSCLSGMLFNTNIKTENRSFAILRPLLEISKEKILLFLQNRNISFFQDPTNLDPRYLRGKMRSDIFPYLRTSFGKEFENSISQISCEATMLRGYFDEKIAPLLSVVENSDLGSYYDFSKTLPDHPYEIHQLLRVIGEKEGFYLNRSEMQLGIALLKTRASNKWIKTDKNALYFDRKMIFIFKRVRQVFDAPISLKEGVFEWGEWRGSVRITDRDDFIIRNHWKDLFQGKMSTVLPVGEYKLGRYDAGLRRYFGDKRPTKEFKAYINNKKVPRILTTFAPLIITQEFVIEDFTSGFVPQNEQKYKFFVELERKLCE